jgi:hypothetical protein
MQRKVASTIGLLGLVLSIAAPIQAAPSFKVGENTIFIDAVENTYRSSGACTAATCLPFDAANDPMGFQKVIPGTSQIVGDILAGIVNISKITSGGITHYFSSATDQFTGYFAQEVIAVHLVPETGPDPFDPLQTTVDHLQLSAPSVDPFAGVGGKPSLAGTGAQFQLFVQEGVGTTVYETNGTTFDDVTKATDGVLWATLGTGVDVPLMTPDLDGFTYSHVDQTLTLENAAGEFFAALNLVTTGAAYNAGTLEQINDVNESELGDVGGLPATFSDIVGTAEIEANPLSFLIDQRPGTPGFQPGPSPWVYQVNDPLHLVRVSEPGTLTLLGLGLLSLFGGLKRWGARWF